MWFYDTITSVCSYFGSQRSLVVAQLGRFLGPPLSPARSVAAAERGDEPRQENEEDEETPTPAFNVDKLRAETKTPFRTVGGATCGVMSYIRRWRGDLYFQVSNWLRCDSLDCCSLPLGLSVKFSGVVLQQLQCLQQDFFLFVLRATRHVDTVPALSTALGLHACSSHTSPV